MKCFQIQYFIHSLIQELRLQYICYRYYTEERETSRRESRETTHYYY